MNLACKIKNISIKRLTTGTYLDTRDGIDFISTNNTKYAFRWLNTCPGTLTIRNYVYDGCRKSELAKIQDGEYKWERMLVLNIYNNEYYVYSYTFKQVYDKIQKGEYMVKINSVGEEYIQIQMNECYEWLDSVVSTKSPLIYDAQLYGIILEKWISRKGNACVKVVVQKAEEEIEVILCVLKSVNEYNQLEVGQRVLVSGTLNRMDNQLWMFNSKIQICQ